MPNNYYERLSEMNPGELADGLAMEQEFDSISRGFAMLPVPHRDGRGFEGPTRVGDPVEETDAVNLATLEKLNLPIYRKKITNEDWNAITDAGIYDVVNASGPNKPPGHQYGVLDVYKFNGAVTQVYYPDVSGKFAIAKRTCTNLSELLWNVWDGAFPANNIVGFVSDGAVIERGSNANGDYVKFADGTMMCACTDIRYSGHPIDSARGSGGLYESSAISSATFPVTFVGMPRPYVHILYGNGLYRPFAVAGSLTASQINFYLQAAGSSTFSGSACIGAIGRWK